MAQDVQAVAAQELAELRPNPALRALQSGWEMAKAKPLGAISAFAIFSLVIIAVFAPLIAPFPHDKLFVGGPHEAPSWNHWFGTDVLGRDVLSRAIFGARISMYVGFIAVITSTIIGALIGLLTGYFQGALDLILQRFIDAINSFPPLILALGIIAIRGPSINNTLIVITIVLIPGSARILRGAVLSVKQNPYVDASLALGATNTRIIFRHILPNVVAPIIVNASILLGAAILFEASLSFLGAGAKSTDPSWGAMISGRPGSGVDQTLDFEIWPWIAIVPAVCISIAVFSFNLLGDAIRDLMDPRLRGGGGRLR